MLVNQLKKEKEVSNSNHNKKLRTSHLSPQVVLLSASENQGLSLASEREREGRLRRNQNKERESQIAKWV